MNTSTKLAYVPVTVEMPCQSTPAEALEIIAPIDLSLVFTGWGPFPAVLGADNQTGVWDTPGITRNPRLSDGTTAIERLTEYTPGHSFAYELSGFTNMLSRFVGKVRGEWTMTPDGPGTIVRWTYSFYPLPNRRLLVGRVLAPLWRRNATKSLRNAVAVVEQTTTTPQFRQGIARG